MENEILFCEYDNRIYIKAKGHITAPICFGLRQRVFNRLDTTPELDGIYSDLSECHYMDSTFMGLLIGFNKKFNNLYHKKINIIAPSTESYNHLAELGLDRILIFTDYKIDFPEKMEVISHKEKITPEFILKAHEELIEISEDNRERFKLVKEILSKQLDNDKDHIK